MKSGRGFSVPSAELEPRGLKGDRRWVIADARGRFVSQRELPALARLVAEPYGVRIVERVVRARNAGRAIVDEAGRRGS